MFGYRFFWSREARPKKGGYKMGNDYISRESFRKNIADILNDETCPLHIAATIEQYLDEEPSVDIGQGKDKDG